MLAVCEHVVELISDCTSLKNTGSNLQVMKSFFSLAFLDLLGSSFDCLMHIKAANCILECCILIFHRPYLTSSVGKWEVFDLIGLMQHQRLKNQACSLSGFCVTLATMYFLKAFRDNLKANQYTPLSSRNIEAGLVITFRGQHLLLLVPTMNHYYGS